MLTLFDHAPPGTEPHLFGWYLGFWITIVTIVAVVVLVGKILQLAERIGVQARLINLPLRQAYSDTLPLPQLRTTIDHAYTIIAGLERARQKLGG